MTLVHFEDVMAAHSSFTTSLEAQMTHDDVIDNTGSTEAASIIGRFNTHMRAAAIESFGPPEELHVHRLQRPVPKSDEVVVQDKRGRTTHRRGHPNRLDPTGSNDPLPPSTGQRILRPGGRGGFRGYRHRGRGCGSWFQYLGVLRGVRRR